MDKIGEISADVILGCFVAAMYGVISGWIFVAGGGFCVVAGVVMLLLLPFAGLRWTFGDALRTIFGGLFVTFIGLGIHHVTFVK